MQRARRALGDLAQAMDRAASRASRGETVGVADTSPPVDLLDHVFREACLDICDAVGTTRAGIWFFNADGSAITCECQFDKRSREFQGGQILRAADYPGYFRTLLAEGTVGAADAGAHPATAEFVDSYFASNGIRSLLDHVVFAGTDPVAVLCAEGCEVVKEWTAEDAAYLRQMAILLGIAIQTRQARYRG